MKALNKLLVLLLATIALASCGGGGGGSQGAFQPTPADTITISAASGSITTNSFTTLTVTVKKHDGSPENDGTTVNASVTPSTIGTVSGKTGSPAGQTASNTLSGGTTTFNFTSSNQAGDATITVSVPAGTNGSTTAATSTKVITVAAGNTQDPRLQLTATTTTLPLNPFSIGESQTSPYPGNFIGSPYIAEVTVTWRHSNGQLVNGTSCVNVSAAPVSVIAFSQLIGSGAGDCSIPQPTEGDLFHNLLGSGPVAVTGGVGTIFVHSSQIPGTGILTVTAIDPDNNQTISSQLVFTVAGAGTTLPTSVSFTSGGSVYVSNSGGAQSTVVSARITDGSNALVADPSGFDNVQFQIVTPNSDARLSAVNAAGQVVTGTTVNTVTHNGVATVTFLAGTVQGPVQVRVIADRGDNNVDNGIQDPVSATATVVVSDGILYSLTLSAPDTNAILVNSVSADTTVTSTSGIPADPNATYSLRVSATGTDRQGNPVLPGTLIKFGAIDSPQSNGVFSISGVKGDPQEGGNLFTALDGHFHTAGGGAGPGDTLIVFGKERHGAPPGNDDLESASKVTVVNSETTLTVATPFNRNDTTGVSVNNGPVLPYIVGRATTGNISSPAATNNFGTATTTLNYPVSVLGRAVAIWAQGNGTDNVTGQSRLVTDAEVLRFPGVAPAAITISPNPIPGNITVPVTVCIVDAALSPLSGVRFNFAFTALGAGSGKVDGISTAGVVPDATGADGCVVTSVTTSGIDATTGGKLTFSAGDATATANITAIGNLALIAVPSSLPGTGGQVRLQLLDGSGHPVPGVLIVGTCTGDNSIGLQIPPGVTDANGNTFTTIQASLNHIGSAGSGSCTFKTSSGSPSVVVTLKGTDLCSTEISPTPPEGCPNVVLTSVTLRIESSNGLPASATIGSSPDGLDCSLNGGLEQECTIQIPSNTYILSANLFSGTTANGWGGTCKQNTTTKATLDVGTTAVTCTLFVNGP
jgi:hypothetical protein